MFRPTFGNGIAVDLLFNLNLIRVLFGLCFHSLSTFGEAFVIVCSSVLLLIVLESALLPFACVLDAGLSTRAGRDGRVLDGRASLMDAVSFHHTLVALGTAV